MNSKNIHVYNTIEHKFGGIRCIDRHLYPVEWKLVIKLAGKSLANAVNEIERETRLRDTTVSYQLIKWWLQNYIIDVFVASNDDVNAIEFFFGADYDNVFVATPFEPTDSVLSEVLFSKIAAIGGKNLEIIEVELHSTDFESTFHFSDLAGFQIPMDNTPFDGNALFDEPWWRRYDCDTWEPMKTEELSDDLLTEAIETKTELISIRDAIYEVTYGEDTDTDTDDEDDGDIEGEIKEASIIAMKDLWIPKKA